MPYTALQAEDCIGESRKTINSNFDFVNTNVASVSSTLTTRFNTISTTYIKQLSAGPGNGITLIPSNGNSVYPDNRVTIDFSNLQNSVNILTSSGSILECLSNPCDGSVVSGRLSSYVWPNVTVAQVLNGTYTDITGSSISYVPPSGTSKVLYRLNYTFSGNADSIGHFKFFVDGTEVTYARHNVRPGGTAGDVRVTFEWAIGIGGTPNTNTGRIASWSTIKNLKLQARYYSSVYNGKVHTTNNWDGAATDQFSMPNLTITAIA